VYNIKKEDPDAEYDLRLNQKLYFNESEALLDYTNLLDQAARSLAFQNLRKFVAFQTDLSNDDISYRCMCSAHKESISGHIYRLRDGRRSKVPKIDFYYSEGGEDNGEVMAVERRDIFKKDDDDDDDEDSEDSHEFDSRRHDRRRSGANERTMLIRGVFKNLHRMRQLKEAIYAFSLCNLRCEIMDCFV
jgi:hypothetical protein